MELLHGPLFQTSPGSRPRRAGRPIRMLALFQKHRLSAYLKASTHGSSARLFVKHLSLALYWINFVRLTFSTDEPGCVCHHMVPA